MPLELKNAGATYQRLVNEMFAEKVVKTMEVKIDEMLVKSLRDTDYIWHLKECFEILIKHQMKLNKTKWSFWVSSEKFPGYLVTHMGIEANPNKLHALRELPSPRNRRKV